MTMAMFADRRPVLRSTIPSRSARSRAARPASASAAMPSRVTVPSVSSIEVKRQAYWRSDECAQRCQLGSSEP